MIQINDVETETGSVAATRGMARARGWRSALAVPMLRNGQPIGVIMASHTQPRAFDPSSVELLQTFADLAVIAIENVRLFTETREARERQTATADILRVISSSPTDVQPMFGDALLIHEHLELKGGPTGPNAPLAGPNPDPIVLRCTA